MMFLVLAEEMQELSPTTRVVPHISAYFRVCPRMLAYPPRTPTYYRVFLRIPRVSPRIPGYSNVFPHIPAYSNVFQRISTYINVFQWIEGVPAPPPSHSPSHPPRLLRYQELQYQVTGPGHTPNASAETDPNVKLSLLPRTFRRTKF